MRRTVIAAGLVLLIAAVAALLHHNDEVSPNSAVAVTSEESASVSIVYETAKKPKPGVSLSPPAEQESVQEKRDEETARTMLDEYGEIRSPRNAPKNPSQMLGGASVVWEPPVPPPPGTGRFGLPPD